MRARSSVVYVFGLAVAACVSATGSPRPPDPPPAQIAKLFDATTPSPKGSVLRVFGDADRLVGWIAGVTSFAGQVARVTIDGNETRVVIGGDNTFVLPTRTTARREATVSVGALVQRITLEPRTVEEPTALFVVDRTAYRPGGKLAFAAFLRQLGSDGEFHPLARTAVEAAIVADTKKTTAAKLKLVSDADGKIAGDYTFSPADPLDTYTVSIPKYRGDAHVALAEFAKAKVKLDVETAFGDRGVELRLRAADFLDQPVTGTVSLTAQVVSDDERGPLDPHVFAYGPPANELERSALLAYLADPDTGSYASTGRVASQVSGAVTLDARGAGSYRVPLHGELLRGHHRLLVEATMVDGNGREVRTSRALPLARRDVQLAISAPHELAVAGAPLDVAVRVVDAAGRTVPATASVAAMRVQPPVATYDLGSYRYASNMGWNGNGWNGGWNNNLVIGNWQPGWQLNDGCPIMNLDARSVRMSGLCRPRWWRRQRPIANPSDALAAMAPVSGGTASVTLDDPGAYRLVASAKLADGSTVWGELGVAVRERDGLPPIVVELDRDQLAQGDHLTGAIHDRYRDAAVLVVVRDARGIVDCRRIALTDGRAPLDIPVERASYGAAIEAYALDDRGEIHAAQKLFHVAPTERALRVTARAKATYGPGDTVDLDVSLDRAEAADVVVSVFDRSLLGVHADRAVDPVSFYYADDRIRARAGLGVIAAQLGDITIAQVLERVRTATPSDDEGAARATADGYLASFKDGNAITLPMLVWLLRSAGVQAIANDTYSPWQIAIDPAKRGTLLAQRVSDFLARDGGTLTLRAAGDAILVGDGTRIAANVPAFTGTHGIAVGNASFSYAAVAAPPPPQMLDLLRRGGDPVRRDFSDSALWIANARTGADGRARLTFKLPDSLTTWQVVVTAVDREMRVGRGTTELRTTRDVMVWPQLPRTFTEGDVVAISAGIHNLTDADRDIAVALRAANLTSLSPLVQTVHVARGGSATVTWRVRAGEAGFAQLAMSASLGGAIADASEKRIPIAPSTAEQVVTASGFADRPLAIRVPDGVDPRDATLDITFAPSLAADLVSTLDYLVEYPYGCAEQTMSRFAPAIRVAGILGNLGIRDGALAARLPRVVDGGMKHLVEMQQPDGGWGWNGHAETHEMITPYVVWGLLEAEKAGYTVPGERTVERGVERIRQLLAARSGDSELSDRTYLMYVLSQRERVPEAQWRAIADRRDKLSDYALALALEIAILRKDTASRERMVAMLHDRAYRTNGTHWRTGGFSRWMEDPSETTAAVLKALVANDASDPIIPEVVAYFAATKRGDRWNSTKDTAMVLYAMSDYLAKTGVRAGGDTFVSYTVDGGTPQRIAFADGLARKVAIAKGDVGRTTTIAFPSSSSGIIAHAVLRYRRSGRDLAPSARGLEVAHALYLLDAKGARVRELHTNDHVPRGAYVESVVAVDATSHEAMRYLLVEDPKPAGAEVLPEHDKRFPASATTWVLREDREGKLAFHHEQTGASTTTRAVLHLEMSGDLVFAPAQAELMYQTQTRGNSGSLVVHVDG